MQYFKIGDNIIIPINKIANVFINNEDPSKIVIWLVGSFTQIISCDNEKTAKEQFQKIEEILSEKSQ